MNSPDDFQGKAKIFMQQRTGEMDRWEAAIRSRDMWQAEAVRHLGLLLGYALAGTVALLATKHFSVVLLLIAFVTFLLSSIILGAGMHFATTGYVELAKAYVKRIESLDVALETQSFDGAIKKGTELRPPSRAGECRHMVAIYCARASAALFLIGTLFLVAAVMLP